MPKDLRSFIEEVAKKRAEDILVMEGEVESRFGLSAVAARLEREGRFQAVLFQKVKGSPLPVITNLTASYERLALALGTTPERMVQTYGERQTNPIPPRIVDEAPVQEVVLTGQDADLSRLPIPIHNELDAGPYITGGCLICKNPDTGVHNVGLYRHQVQGPHQFGVWFHEGHDGNYLMKRYSEMNQEMQVAVAIGHHPGFIMGAVSRLPGFGGEFEEAGALLGEPLELVRAKTVDLLVPARAEIVIEGVIPPRATQYEGPFAEWPGHYTEAGDKPFIEVKAITMRRDAIYYDVFAGHREHTVLGSLPRMGSIYRRVKQAVPGLVNVNVPAHCRMHCYISFRKRGDAEVKKAAFAALLTEPENLKLVILVDDDINVFNEPEVMWAVGTRFRAERGLLVIPDWSGPGGLNPVGYDYHPDGSKTPSMTTAVVMDATKPAPPASYPPRALVPRELVEKVDLKALKSYARA